MKAIYLDEPGKVSIRDVEMPERRSGEALLKMRYGGICGSDLGTYRGSNAYVTYPRIPGHELACEIVEIDPNEKGLKPGSLVTCNPYFNCNHCYACRHGLVNACMDNQTMGVQREGGFAEYLVMPVQRLFDGKGLPAKTLALIEPFCISHHGVARAAVKSGERVLVIGAGTIGILAAIAAKIKGAEVTICDIAEEKLIYAHGAFGLDHMLLNASQEAFRDHVNDYTDGNGYDVTIEAAGAADAFTNCIDAACYGGRVVDIGVSKQHLNDFFYTIIQKKELSILGSRNAMDKDFTELIDFAREVPLEKLITDTYPLDDAERAFRDFSTNAGRMLKVVIDFS